MNLQQVPVGEAETVFRDTRRRIQHIVGCKDDQIIKLSTIEAQTMQSQKGLLAPKYQFALDKINQFILKTHVMFILKETE